MTQFTNMYLDQHVQLSFDHHGGTVEEQAARLLLGPNRLRAEAETNAIVSRHPAIPGLPALAARALRLGTP